ncbi:MAG TPA: bifunctional glutamate N-acetyltransferase/amino-acid acetyltransferase ArgJ [Candidatus Glassbacteria bacterium]|nr:bifunctional glutamate N-acetyltransferase/amino-acid acetyltransferase ArgJ [Candidatus Glassbacteria bacterium]
MRLVPGTVDSVAGFRAAGVACGIKASGAPDLGVILGEVPCAAAAVFTTNRVKAAPLLVCRERLAQNPAGVRAIVVNSGIANACTGQRGIDDARAVAVEAESVFGLEPGSALVMSTGVIGEPLPLNKINKGLRKFAGGLELTGETTFQRAIMTTDTVEKTVCVEFEVEGVRARLGGAAKGAGMIHPNLATMLSFLTTDAALTPPALACALRKAVNLSFNRISVDGDRSPNDSVFLLASGKSGAPVIDSENSPGYEAFLEALITASVELAKSIAADGEGATRLVEIQVRGAGSDEQAEKIARTVANSPLVKTAIYGNDPNWGRIVSAVGYSGVPVDLGELVVSFGEVEAFRNGEPTRVARTELADKLRGKQISINISVGGGKGTCTFWTCDFSYDYVKINADYHT